MSSAARPLSEPQVLAHTKRRLFPDDSEPSSYVVADTQFSQDEWRPGQPIEPAVRDCLAPFNHVEIGGGFPDLVASHHSSPNYSRSNASGTSHRWSPSRRKG